MYGGKGIPLNVQNGVYSTMQDNCTHRHLDRFNRWHILDPFDLSICGPRSSVHHFLCVDSLALLTSRQPVVKESFPPFSSISRQRDILEEPARPTSVFTVWPPSTQQSAGRGQGHHISGETQGKNSSGFGLLSGRSRSTKGQSDDHKKINEATGQWRRHLLSFSGKHVGFDRAHRHADIWTQECQKRTSAIEVIHGSCVGLDAATVRASTRWDSC